MNSENVKRHYTNEGLLTRVESALQNAGRSDEPIAWSEIAGLDQFHVRGLAATKELADGLHLAGGETVLDVGCGLGGPARYLAAVYGCRVTGIDLTPAYVEVAQMLSVRTGLADLLTFVQGDALEMPFAPGSFDHAWTQHVAMNVADKLGFYAEIYRVLKPGGRLAIYDVVRGSENGEPVIYPVPWAQNAQTSFLATPPEMEQALAQAGFRAISSVDTTPLVLASLSTAPGLPQAAGGISGLTLALVMGPDFGQMFANLAQNAKQGSVGFREVIVQKD